MEEHRVGETFIIGKETKIKIKESQCCDKCHYYTLAGSKICGFLSDIEPCKGDYRKDGKDIIFENAATSEEILECQKLKETMENFWEKTLLKSLPHPIENKKPKKLPTSWENYCETTPIKNRECWITDLSRIAKELKLGDKKRDIINDKNLLRNKESAKAHLALMQLEQLRDSYRQGWKPNYDDFNETKYDIVVDGHSITKSQHITGQRFLSFQTEELRDLFYDNFMDLIEIAKKLI